MRRVVFAVVLALSAFAGRSTSFATPGLTSVSPTDGTVGTQLVIGGVELGNKAPKAVLQLHGNPSAKAYPLKLKGPYDGSTLHALVAAVQPGVYDVIVTPKGGAPITLASAFTAHGPEPSGISDADAGGGERVTITGAYFGNKKGKVYIGGPPPKAGSREKSTGTGVSQTIILWTVSQIVISMSDHNPDGSQTVYIDGPGGADGSVSITVDPPISNGLHIAVNFENGGQPPFTGDRLHSFALVVRGAAFQIHGESDASSAVKYKIDIAGAGALNTGAADPSQLGATYSQNINSGGPVWASPTAASFFVKVTSRTGRHIKGRFGGALQSATGTPTDLSCFGDFSLNATQEN